jgi:oligopeptidase B
VTNLDARDFRVCTAPHDAPHHWEEFVAHRPGWRITDFECFAGHGVLARWEDAQQRLHVVGRDGTMRAIDLTDQPHEIDLDANPEWDTTEVRVAWQSLVSPPSIMSVDAGTLSTRVLKTIEVPGADLARYVSERTWALSPDGTRVPVDVVRARDTPVDGSAPCLVYVYGSYEISMPPWFSVARLSLLDRGWCWALAHPRGGGEMGRDWYEQGKLLAKRNTFDDTIACARHLVATGRAAPGKVAIRGGSAGGLCVGACATMAPDDFAAVVAEVPFVDVVTTMSDPTLPLTVTEWEEWGDPREEPWASYIASYSPYDNLHPRSYPAMFVTAGLNDPRVSYHEPAKLVAKLRHLSPGTTVVFTCEMGAGHGGPSGRYDRWREEARTIAFLLAEAGSGGVNP